VFILDNDLVELILLRKICGECALKFQSELLMKISSFADTIIIGFRKRFV